MLLNVLLYTMDSNNQVTKGLLNDGSASETKFLDMVPLIKRLSRNMEDFNISST